MHLKIDSTAQVSDIDYQGIERQFIQLLHLDNLDNEIAKKPSLKEEFEEALAHALSDSLDEAERNPQSLLFVQRILYRINRLKLFWYDDLKNYTNEDSPYLFGIQNKIELTWQNWNRIKLILNRSARLLKSRKPCKIG